MAETEPNPLLRYLVNNPDVFATNLARALEHEFVAEAVKRRRGKRPDRLVERLRRYVMDIHRSTPSSRRRLRRSSLFRLCWNEA